MGLPIPMHPGDVTDEWMESAMAAAPGSLASMTVEPLPQGGLAGRLARAAREGANGTHLPRSVIIKHIPHGEEWKTAFKESGTPKVGGIAVLTDSDDTKSTASGDYRNFRACRG